MLVWQHLSVSGMMEGGYTGAMDSNDKIVPNDNVPNSQYSKDIGYNMMYSTTGIDDIISSHLAYDRNILLIGGCSNQVVDTVEACTGGIMTAVDAQAIDAKIDNGVAYSGKIIGNDSYDSGSAGNCSYAVGSTEADYDLTITEADCMLIGNYGEFN